MKTIRKNTFETNSSSTHSLTLSNTSLDSEVCSWEKRTNRGKIVLTKDDEYIILPKKFGWEFEKYNDTDTKISYLAIIARDLKNEQLKEWLNEIICEEGNAKKVIWGIEYKDSDDEWRNSYIDHVGEAKKLQDIISSKENVKNFILNINSWLFLGNDNEYCHPNFYMTEEEIEQKTHIIKFLDNEDYEPAFYSFVENDKEFQEFVYHYFWGYMKYLDRVKNHGQYKYNPIHKNILGCEIKNKRKISKLEYCVHGCTRIIIEWDEREFDYKEKEYVIHKKGKTVLSLRKLVDNEG